MVTEAIDVEVAFASADETTKPIEARESVSPSNFFIFPLQTKIEPGSLDLSGRARPWYIRHIVRAKSYIFFRRVFIYPQDLKKHW